MTGGQRVALFGACLIVMSGFAFAGGKKETKLKSKDLPKPAAETAAAITQAPSADWTTVTDGQTVEVSGRIRLVGSDPFPDLVLTDDQGKDWYIDDASKAVVKGLEQQRVRVSAVVSLKTLKLANGTALPERKILSSVSVLK